MREILWTKLTRISNGLSIVTLSEILAGHMGHQRETQWQRDSKKSSNAV